MELSLHIEMAHSLDTDLFLLVLRRFIARRGQLQEFCSEEVTSQSENMSA